MLTVESSEQFNLKAFQSKIMLNVLLSQFLTCIKFQSFQVMAGYDEGRDPRQIPNVEVPAYSQHVSHIVC